MADKLAQCYLTRNSALLVGAGSVLLDHQCMGIREQKEWRRQQLTKLMDEVGQTKLAETTGIPAAYLFQMSRGTGKNKRGVSDENAELIEAKTKRPGWFDFGGSVEKDKPGKKSAPDWAGKRTAAQLRLEILVSDNIEKLKDDQAQAIITLIESWLHQSRPHPAKKKKEKA